MDDPAEKIRAQPGDTSELGRLRRRVVELEELLEQGGTSADILRRLRASELRYRAIVEDQTELICRWRPNGTLIFVNEAYCRTFGKRREELIGRTFIPLVPVEDRQVVTDAMERLSLDEPVVVIEHRVILPDGRVRWQQWSDRAFFDELGRLVEVQSVGRDVTELREAEAERERLRDELDRAQRLESLGLLAGGIAHDFNNLLTGILGNASIARRSAQEPRTMRALDEVLVAGRRAASLVRELLAYAGKGALQVRPLDPSAHAEEILRVLTASLPEGVEVRHELPDDLPAVEVDPAQFQQLLMNLVLNAAEASQEGGRLVTVRVQHVRFGDSRLLPEVVAGRLGRGDYVVLDVQDTGKGIRREEVRKVLEPFYSTKQAGRGLGLAAVVGIVRAYDGALFIEGRGGVGSVFRVYLRASSRRPEPPDQALAPEDLSGEGLVLVVDDDPVVRDFCVRALEPHGYAVIALDEGAAAVDFLQESGSEVALVLLDLVMPGVDGAAVLREMQGMSARPPVVVMSGFTEDTLHERLGDLPTAGFLHKPFEEARLARAVKGAARAVNRSGRPSVGGSPPV